MEKIVEEMRIHGRGFLLDILEAYDLDTSYAKELTASWAEQKAQLAEKFQFSAENNYRVRLPNNSLDTAEIYQQFRYSVLTLLEFMQFWERDFFITFLYDSIDEYKKAYGESSLQAAYAPFRHVVLPHFIATNKLFSGQKFSKWLNRHFCPENGKFLHEYLQHIPSYVQHNIAKELQFNLLRKPWAGYVKAFLPTLFEKCTVVPYHLELSINPFDIVGVNHNVSYSSCLNRTGEYFNTVFSYIRDNFTLLLSRYNVNGTRVGRSWVYVADDYLCLALPYGTINLHDIRTAGDWIASHIEAVGSPQLLYVDNPRKQVLPKLDRYTPENIYVDSASEGTWYVNPAARNLRITYADPICVSCGCSHQNNPRNGLCETCDEEIFVCDECGGVFQDDEIIWLDNLDRYVCHACYDKTYFRCESCGRHHNYEERIGVYTGEGYGWWCEDCFNEYAFVCGECGEAYNYGGYETQHDGILCESCSENYSYCDHCGYYVCNDKIRLDRDGNAWCEQCADDAGLVL